MRRGWRRHAERFDEIVWRQDNAARRFDKHEAPFELARELVWSDILKRKDVQHRDHPERWNALARWPDPDGSDTLMFVVYAKQNRELILISMRLATLEEADLYDRTS